MKYYHKILFSIAISVAMFGCKNTSESQLLSTKETVLFELPRENVNFPRYVEELKQYARLNGISEETLDIAFKDVYFLERVVTADRNQPERKMTLEDYLARVLPKSRMTQTKEKFNEYFPQLSQATILTGTPQEYIVALWALESGFGRNQGKEDVISAVSTLAFEGRREKFFSRELLSALQILDKGYISKDLFKGSWAGAMGQNQFIPSSLLAYGLDGDGDGKIDIWTNQDDVFASIGNYLAIIGWDKNSPWGNKVRLPKSFNVALAGLNVEQSKTVAEWKALGVKVTDGKAQPAAKQQAWIILPDDDPAKAYLVYSNFKTLMHWNRSYYFGISVGMLADSLKDK